MEETLRMKIDSVLLEEFETLMDEIGMTPESAITVFIKTAVREQRIPFEIRGSKKIENIPKTAKFEPKTNNDQTIDLTELLSGGTVNFADFHNNK